MKSKWFKSAPDDLLTETLKLLSITSNNTVSYKMEAVFLIDSLFSLIEHNHPLDSNTAHDLFKKALFNYFLSSKTSGPNRLLVEFEKLCNTLPQSKKYTLITTLQLARHYVFPQYVISNCKIKILNELPKKYKSSRANALSESTQDNYNEDGLAYAVITTTAKSAKSAVIQANDAFATLSALMQLGFKKPIQFLATTDAAKYPSRLVIIQGEFQTLHLATGKCHPDALWNNNEYEQRTPIKLRNQQTTVTLTQKRLRQLNRLPFKNHIIDALRNYSTAISSNHPELRFLKLWVALEQLLDTDDTETLIKRIAFFYTEKNAQKSILRSLRLARNNHIHGGKNPPNIDLKIFQLCQHLEHAILFFMSNPFRYKSIEEIITFISLNTEESSIHSQIKKLKAALKFIS
jgi:hypothetical protein